MSSPALIERDWHHSADPIPLLHHLFPMHGHHSTPEQPRKLRLYYAACARRVYGRLNSIQRGFLEAAERLADGSISRTVLSEIMELGEERVDGSEVTPREIRKLADLMECDPSAWGEGVPGIDTTDRQRLGWLAVQSLRELVPTPLWVHRSLHSADLVREVFPNPFRAAVWQSEWRSTDAVGIAKKMYGSRRFDAMGELADALEESGCQDAEILLHCRDENDVHYRGCWVIDGLLDQIRSGQSVS